jgi:DNA-binding MarR family transcriptional regulator
MALTDEKPLALVHILSNRIGRAFHSEVETKYGLSIAEWRVLLTLSAEPGITAAEITNRWALEKMLVNRAIQQLVDSGNISRTRNPQDLRSFTLTMTAKGAKLYDKISPAANKRYNELQSAVSKQELEVTVRALKRMIRRAEELY